MESSNPIALITYLYKDFKRYCDRQLEPYELANGVYFYLIYINRYPGCSLADLTAVMKVDKAYVTRIVKRLCELGYIRKEKSEKDSRACCLYMLEGGKAALEKIRELFFTWNQELAQGMAEGEFETLSRLLQKAAGIKTPLVPDEPPCEE